MARVMLYISDLIVPFLIFYVVMEGLAAKRPVYDDCLLYTSCCVRR